MADLEIIRKEIEKLEKLNNKKNHDEIVTQLQKINECFLRNVIIKINRLEIYPVEVEIYYYYNYKENDEEKIIFDDGFCHKNELQNGKDNVRFGKFYFHRAGRGITASSLIDTNRGGVDICLSRGDYYLSILLRSVYVKDRTNNKKNIFITGIHRIVNRITDELESLLEYGDINIEYKIYENQEEKEKFFKNEKEVNIQDFKFKCSNHCRIKGADYFEHDKEKNFTLNTYIDNKTIISEIKKYNSIYNDLEDK